MKTSNSLVVECAGPEKTIEIGQQIGKQLRGSEIIELVGDVGSGKTTFVKGLAKGAGSEDHVSSPTFTVEQVYKGRVEIHHLDLYRLGEPGLIAHQLEESMPDPSSVVVLEWADTVAGILPEDRIKIRFEVTGENGRRLTIDLPEHFNLGLSK